MKLKSIVLPVVFVCTLALGACSTNPTNRTTITDPELKSFISRFLPTQQEHYSLAEAL